MKNDQEINKELLEACEYARMTLSDVTVSKQKRYIQQALEKLNDVLNKVN
jgi:hypothetical protein